MAEADWVRPLLRAQFTQFIVDEQVFDTALYDPFGLRRVREVAEQGRSYAQRARELLLACLSPAQREQLAEYGWFVVRGSLGGHYRIDAGYYSGNVSLLDKGGHRVRSFCAHGRDPMPTADHLLLQKLTLESDEQAFLDVAY